jgi:hypothetical protein
MNCSALNGIFFIDDARIAFSASVFLKNNATLTNQDFSNDELRCGVLFQRCIFDSQHEAVPGYAVVIFKNCLFNRTTRTLIHMKHMDTWGCEGIPLEESIQDLVSGLTMLVFLGVAIAAGHFWYKRCKTPKRD